MRTNEKSFNETLYHTIPSISMGVFFISVLLFGLSILNYAFIVVGLISIFFIRDKIFIQLITKNMIFLFSTTVIIILNAIVLYFSKNHKPELTFIILPVFLSWVFYLYITYRDELKKITEA